jgi:hypothetical protein
MEATTVDDLFQIFKQPSVTKSASFTLLLGHSELKNGQVETGIPQINMDQLNHRYSFDDIEVMTQEQFDCMYDLVEEGGMINMVTVSNKLTRRLLLQQDDWSEWRESEYSTRSVRKKQHMFGEPCKTTKISAVFNLIWTYVVKELDGRKKARCTCDGSTRGGQVRVLDHTFANSIDQTGSQIFTQLQLQRTF